MEVDQDRWMIARRQLDAMAETTDVETRFSLWRAAKRYAERREDCGASTALENAGSPLAAHCRGSGQDRDWV